MAVVSMSWGRAQLNKAAWRPAREDRSVRLQRGALQLPAHTQLLLDETQLAAGTLTSAGVDNLKVACNTPQPCLSVSRPTWTLVEQAL